jgi:Na+/H+-dicarboxylate symporter
MTVNRAEWDRWSLVATRTMAIGFVALFVMVALAASIRTFGGSNLYFRELIGLIALTCLVLVFGLTICLIMVSKKPRRITRRARDEEGPIPR